MKIRVFKIGGGFMATINGSKDSDDYIGNGNTPKEAIGALMLSISENEFEVKIDIEPEDR